MGLENKVIKLIVRTLEYEYHNADFNDYSLILFDSNVKHSLMTSAYNEERAVRGRDFTVKNNFPEITSFERLSNIF
jgi:galactokinase